MTTFRFNLIAALFTSLCLSHAVPGVGDDGESQEPSRPEVKVTLIEAGSEPRAPLRFRPAAGQTTQTEMLTRMTMTQAMGEFEMPPMAMPEMRIVVTTTVAEVTDDGDITYAAEFTDTSVRGEPGVNPVVHRQMENMLRSMRGTSVGGTVSDRGIVRSGELRLPAGVDPEMRQQMEGLASSLDQFASPVPEEAVGVGAKWSVSTTLLSYGMTIEQTATYTLTAIDGDAFEVDVDMQQTAQPQDVENPMLPPDATMRLISFRSSGSGKSKLSLTHVMPLRAQVEVSNYSEMSVSMEGETQRMSQQMDMDMRMSEVEDDASP